MTNLNHEPDILLTRLDELDLADKDINQRIIEIKKNKEIIKTNKILYYNESNDLEIKENYYRSVLKDSGSLFNKYHLLLKKTHNPVPYFVSKDQYLYSWVDMQPDGSIKNIYSGIHQDPQDLVKRDFETIQRKYEEFEELLLQNNNGLTETRKKKISNIDYELKFNTEHIVPQSWYGSDEPMKGDLHHLFACQPECNIKRSNLPFADFSFYTPESKEEKIRNQCGVVMDGKFEPEYGKGTVARAMLYFLVRYPRTIKKSFIHLIDIPLLIL